MLKQLKTLAPKGLAILLCIALMLPLIPVEAFGTEANELCESSLAQLQNAEENHNEILRQIERSVDEPIVITPTTANAHIHLFYKTVDMLQNYERALIINGDPTIATLPIAVIAEIAENMQEKEAYDDALLSFSIKTNTHEGGFISVETAFMVDGISVWLFDAAYTLQVNLANHNPIVPIYYEAMQDERWWDELYDYQIHRIAGIFNERAAQGNFDTLTGVFEIETNAAGIHAIGYVPALRRLSLTMGAPEIIDLAGNSPTQIMDVLPINRYGRLLIPIRHIAEMLGAEVSWERATNYTPMQVSINLDNETIAFGVGEITPELKVMGMDVPAEVIENRTFVPLRFIMEAFGADVRWNDGNIEIIWASANCTMGIPNNFAILYDENEETEDESVAQRLSVAPQHSINIPRETMSSQSEHQSTPSTQPTPSPIPPQTPTPAPIPPTTSVPPHTPTPPLAPGSNIGIPYIPMFAEIEIPDPATQGAMTDVRATRGARNLAIEVSTDGYAVLHVTIYCDNNVTRIATGNTFIGNSKNGDFVNISLSSSLPQHFFVYSIITDHNGQALSDPMVFVEYSSMYEEFLAMTEYSFPQYRVISLDCDINNNFMVTAEGVPLINMDWRDDTVTVIDGATFIFHNAQSDIALLNVGDKIVVTKYDNVHIYKVEIINIVASGGDIVIVACGDTPDMTQFFDHIRIDMTYYMADPHAPLTGFMALALTPVPTYNQYAEITPTFINRQHSYNRSFNRVFGGSDSNVELNANIGISVWINASVSYSVRWTLFIPTGITINARFSIRYEADITASASATTRPPNNTPTTIEIVNKGINLGLIGGSIRLELVIDWNAHANGTLQFSAGGEVGVIFGTSGTQRFATTQPTVFTPNFDASVQFSIGPRISGSITLLGVTATLWMHPMIQINASAHHDIGRIPNPSRDRHHACYACITGEIRLRIDAGFRLTYRILVFSGTIIDTRGTLLNRQVFAFYHSSRSPVNSLHGGRPASGRGRMCNNYQWRIELHPVNDIANYTVDGALMDVSRIHFVGNTFDEIFISSGEGRHYSFMHNGMHVVDASYRGFQFPATFFTVNGGPGEAIISTVFRPVESLTFSTDRIYLNAVGAMGQLVPNLYPSNASDRRLQFKSSNPNVAYVNSAGTIIAQGTGSATVTVRTLCNYFLGEPHVATISIVISERVRGISLQPENIRLRVGDAGVQLFPTIYPLYACNTNVIWGVASNANYINVNQGFITPIMSSQDGRMQVYVRTEDGGHLAYAWVEVTNPATEVHIYCQQTDLRLDNNNDIIHARVGDIIFIRTALYPADADTTNVTLISNNPGVIIPGRFEGSLNPLRPGRAVVRATTNDGFAYSYITITVRSAPYDIPTLTAVFGDCLSDIDLTELDTDTGVYSWEQLGLVGNAGLQQHTLIFTPNDINYPPEIKTVDVYVSPKPIIVTASRNAPAEVLTPLNPQTTVNIVVSELLDDFPITVSLIGYPAIQGIGGLSFMGDAPTLTNAYNMTTATIVYNGVAAVTNGQINARITLIGENATNYVIANLSDLQFEIIDGQASSRSIPVSQGNFIEFNAFANTLHGSQRYFHLVENIDASGIPWAAIGRMLMNGFTGNLDGRNHNIANLSINQPDELHGMFGIIGENGHVRNVGLVNASVIGGRNHQYGHIGAIAAVNEGLIENVFATGNVSGTTVVGGLVGLNDITGRIVNSYSTAAVSITGTPTNMMTPVGGLVGANNGAIENSYATGTVVGLIVSGGLVGFNAGVISTSYATGDVSGVDILAGLVGFTTNYGVIRNSAALNVNLNWSTTATPIFGRITTVQNLNAVTLAHNYSRLNMLLNGELITAFYPPQCDYLDGINVSSGTASNQFHNQQFWQSMGFDFGTVWQWNSATSLPILQNVGGVQSPVAPFSGIAPMSSLAPIQAPSIYVNIVGNGDVTIFIENGEATVSSFALFGYKFSEWRDVEDNIVSVDPVFTFNVAQAVNTITMRKLNAHIMPLSSDGFSVEVSFAMPYTEAGALILIAIFVEDEGLSWVGNITLPPFGKPENEIDTNTDDDDEYDEDEGDEEDDVFYDEDNDVVINDSHENDDEHVPESSIDGESDVDYPVNGDSTDDNESSLNGDDKNNANTPEYNDYSTDTEGSNGKNDVNNSDKTYEDNGTFEDGTIYDNDDIPSTEIPKYDDGIVEA